MCKVNKFLISFLFIIIFTNQLFAKENSASIFVYHRFGENKYPTTNTTISQFKEHINELIKNNYNVVSIEEIIDAFKNKHKLVKCLTPVFLSSLSGHATMLLPFNPFKTDQSDLR